MSHDNLSLALERLRCVAKAYAGSRAEFAAKFDQLNLHFLSKQFVLRFRAYNFIRSES